MGLNASKVEGNKSKKSFVEQPELENGNYPARLVQVIDLGLQPQKPFKGEEKPPVHQIMLTYELVDEFMVDEEGNPLEDKPRWVSEQFPLYSLEAERATSTKRYNAFDPEHVYEGDFSQCVEAPVMLTLVINAKGERVYVNIGGAAKMRGRDAEKTPALKNPPKVFDLTDPDLEIFGSLPEWLQEKIKSNLNFRGSLLEKRLSGEDVAEVAEVPNVDPDAEPDTPWD